MSAVQMSHLPELRPGAAAPDLALRNQFGETVELSALAGRRVVVMFYPFAFSRVCGAELSEVHRRWVEFQQLGAVVLAVSCDAVHTLRAYAEHLSGSTSAQERGEDQGKLEEHEGPDEREGLHLLSDFWPHGAAAQSYGAFNPATGAAQRVSFLIDEHLRFAHQVASENGEARSLDHTLELLRSM